MHSVEYPLSPPSLEELADVLSPALATNFKTSSVTVSQCPDLRQPPFDLAAAGLSGRECIADIGGQPNLFPEPRLDTRYSMVSCARAMGMSQEGGMIIGAGAGPWFNLDTNSELAPNFAWEGTFDSVQNLTYYTAVSKDSAQKPLCARSESTDCALMMNLFGSAGNPGPVLKITAKTRVGKEKSFTDCIRHALTKHYGSEHPISLGGAFVIKRGTINFHIMPDFPATKPPGQQYTFADPAQLNAWLTYHDFPANANNTPIVCLSVFHSADPGKRMGLRMEHTHCFTTDGSMRGGHYHYDLDDEEVEYEGYFQTAKVVYRIERPEVTLERDLHD